MNSEADKPISNATDIPWLEDPEFQREAYAIARRFVWRFSLPVTAEDLYQTVIVRILDYFQRTRRGREINDLLAYFYTVARNEARRLFAKEKGHLKVPLDDVADVAFSDRLENVRLIESTLLLEEILKRLDDKERLLFRLWINGMNYRQLAILMNVSHVTARNRVFRLLDKIRELI